MKRYYTIILAILLSVPLLAQVERKVIIEHFTNTRCGTCAAKNPAFYQILAAYPQVLHIAYHPSSPYVSCVLSQHNPVENDDRTKFYNVFGGTPRTVIQGEVVPPGGPLITSEKIEEHLGKNSNYKVSVSKNFISGNIYKMTIEIERVGGDDDETILVYSGLAEKEVHYNAPNGEDLHHDVFRKMMFYEAISLNARNSKIFEMEYTTHEDWDENEIFAYAIIHNNETFEVEQSASSLDSPTGILKPAISNIDNLVYPNPASDVIRIRDEFIDNFVQAELYAITGNRVGVFNDLRQIDVSGLTNGMYFLKLTDKDNKQYSTRLLKNSR